jgi:cytochrome bd-type quinol oxidase subunit 2
VSVCFRLYVHLCICVCVYVCVYMCVCMCVLPGVKVRHTTAATTVRLSATLCLVVITAVTLNMCVWESEYKHQCGHERLFECLCQLDTALIAMAGPIVILSTTLLLLNKRQETADISSVCSACSMQRWSQWHVPSFPTPPH